MYVYVYVYVCRCAVCNRRPDLAVGNKRDARQVWYVCMYVGNLGLVRGAAQGG
jgi:hypothetical protein